jgi:uncharacterized protein (DUF302 family)
MASASASVAPDGIVTIPSHHSVDDTAERLERILSAKGVVLFALVDHSGEAAKADLQMPPAKLLIFGNPKAGPPLMQAAPGAAVDLPLKFLIAEDTQGAVHVSWNSPEFLSVGDPDDLGCLPPGNLLR